jgi:hypothetical protein
VARSRDEGRRRLCVHLFGLSLPVVSTFTSPRAWASTLLGIHEFLREFPGHAAARAMRVTLTRRLVDLWNGCATDEWPWFEPSATYDNARLAQALILGGRWTPDPEALEVGLKALRWLASIQRTQAGHFRPIGSNGFYQRDGGRADFDQQPLEAQAMVGACLEAFRVTTDPAWQREARRAFEWFLGRNDLGLALYDFSTGGCSDGLHADRISENQGAESSLAFQIALAEMNQAEHLSAHPASGT